MTRGTMEVLLTIPWAFPRNSSTEICGNFMLPSHLPSKGPFSYFQLHPLYNPLLLNVKKIKRERITLFSYFSDFYYYSLSGEKESYSFLIFLTLITTPFQERKNHILFLFFWLLLLPFQERKNHILFLFFWLLLLLPFMRERITFFSYFPGSYY